MIKYNDIPKAVINEISFMLGSIEECQSEYLQPILKAHGYELPEGFLMIEPKDDVDLTIDIYEKLFLTGICGVFE